MEESGIVEVEHYDQASSLVSDFLFGKHKHILINKYCVFRGESSAKFKLLPSALRPEKRKQLRLFAGGGFGDEAGFDEMTKEGTEPSYFQIEDEFKALKRFYLKADRRGLILPNVERLRGFDNYAGDWFYDKDEVWIPNDMRELAGLAQHYGVPTRMLDWTFDFFVALFFAAQDAAKKYSEKQSFEDDYLVLWVLNTEMLTSQKEFTDNKDFSLYLVRPPYSNNPNLAAQSGLFSFVEVPWRRNRPNRYFNETVDRTPLDEILVNRLGKHAVMGTVLFKIHLPVSECFNLMDILDCLHYDSARIFPGYGGVAKQIYEEGFLHNKRPRPTPQQSNIEEKAPEGSGGATA